jgi:hypothetical protein
MLQTYIFNQYITNNNAALEGGRDELGAASLHWREWKERVERYLTEKSTFHLI